MPTWSNSKSKNKKFSNVNVCALLSFFRRNSKLNIDFDFLAAKKTNQSGKLNNKSQLALLKEILYDDQQLKCLLQKSDSTLKLVKHLFDDNNDEEDTRSICSTNMVGFLFFLWI
jgi:hypothetical protein